MTYADEFFQHTNKYVESEHINAKNLKEVLFFFSSDDSIIENSRKDWEKRKQSYEKKMFCVGFLIVILFFASFAVPSPAIMAFCVVSSVVAMMLVFDFYKKMICWYADLIRYCKPLTETSFCPDLLALTKDHKNVEKYVQIVNRKRQLYWYDYKFANFIVYFDIQSENKNRNTEACKELHNL